MYIYVCSNGYNYDNNLQKVGYNPYNYGYIYICVYIIYIYMSYVNIIEPQNSAAVILLSPPFVRLREASLAAMAIFSNTCSLCAMPPLSLGSASWPGDF